jgi:hypothetical protein
MQSTDLPEVLALFTFYVSYTLFFLLVAQGYLVNWLAGYHTYKTLQVSSVVLFPPYGSTALVDLGLLPLLGSSSTLGRFSLD